MTGFEGNYISITNKHSIKSSLSFVEANYREDKSADYTIPFTPPLKLPAEYNNFTNGNTGLITHLVTGKIKLGNLKQLPIVTTNLILSTVQSF